MASADKEHGVNSIVTVDLDSTLCDTGHRHHMIDRVRGTDWVAYSKACSDDGLVAGTAALVRTLAHVSQIHYVTGRTEAARPETEAWLRSHDLPMDGLWMDDTPSGDHFAVYGSHSVYKVLRVRQVEEFTGKRVILHIDDWAEVKVALEQAGYPCICVRTPQEIQTLTSPHADHPVSLR